jgi:uncharacterized RDD family membrane protein YckC
MARIARVSGRKSPESAGTFSYSSENAKVSKAKTQRKFTFSRSNETGHLNEAIEMKTFQNGNCVARQTGKAVMENLNYAGFWWRVLASLIDSVALAIAGCIFGIGIGLVLVIAQLSNGMDQHTSKVLLNSISNVIGLLINWLYFALLESSPWQATLGKKVCGLTVTDTDGVRISFGKASARHWSKIPSGLLCFAGYIMAAFTERKQALHDRIAKTVVLREAD